MVINRKLIVSRLVILTVLIIIFDHTVGWNFRYIVDALRRLYRDGIAETWDRSERPDYGIALLPDQIFPDQAKTALDGLHELRIQNYSIDPSFLVHPKLPDQLIQQRLIEGAWPIEFRQDSRYRVFGSAEASCPVLWRKREVSIGDCSI